MILVLPRRYGCCLSLWCRICGNGCFGVRGVVVVVYAVLLGLRHAASYPLNRPVEAFHGLLEASQCRVVVDPLGVSPVLDAGSLFVDQEHPVGLGE